MKTILFLAANPNDTARLDLETEIREIKEGLQRAQERTQFAFKPWLAVRAQDIRRGMLDEKPQIVHFSGHGEGEDGILLKDLSGDSKPVSSEALAGLFELFADTVECVILNACYSAPQATAIARHIPIVIGMSQAISDEAALEFATAFYDALGAGECYEFAYKLACNAIQLAGISEAWTPVLIQKGAQAPQTDSQPLPPADEIPDRTDAGIVTPENPPTEEERPAVFLAEVSDDLSVRREDMARMLKNQGFRVIPETLYMFPTEAELTRVLHADLARCRAFVQLLSEYSPQRPAGLTTPQLQYDCALAAGLPLYQWRDRRLDPDTAQDSAHRTLLTGSRVTALSLLEFQDYLRDELKIIITSQTDTETPETRYEFVFINAASTDTGLAQEIQQVLFEYGISSGLPMLITPDASPQTIREDLENNLLWCDAVIVTYSCGTTAGWVRKQLLQCNRILGKRETPLRVIAVYDKPDTPKPPLNMRLHNLHILHCPQPRDPHCLGRFMEALQP